MARYKCPRCQTMLEAASPEGLSCNVCGFPGADLRAAGPPPGFQPVPPPPQWAPPPGAYAQQQQMAQPGMRQVNWVVLLIVSILVGSLGVDRFMMGHVGLGILKLITLGGCGIWWLIDVILIATKYQFAGIQYVQT